MIRNLQREAVKKGVKPYQFKDWIKRKHGGVMTVWRLRRDGHMGTSLPCVLCRKAIDKYEIQWMAYDGVNWIKSWVDENLPKSIPTNRQKRIFNFS